MEKKPIKFTNRCQFEYLVESMEKNLEMAMGVRGLYRTTDNKEFWNELSVKLNALGPPTRDGAGWLKVWTDQKYLTKQKVQHKNNRSKFPRPGRKRPVFFNSLERSIIRLLRLEADPKPVGMSFKIKSPSPDVEVVNVPVESDINISDDSQHENLEQTVNIKSSDARISHNKKGFTKNDTRVENQIITPLSKQAIENNTNKNEDRMRLIRKQTEIQAGILREQEKTNSYLKRYTQIKEEKLQLYREELAEKRAFRNRILELKGEKFDQLFETAEIKIEPFEEVEV